MNRQGHRKNENKVRDPIYITGGEGRSLGEGMRTPLTRPRVVVVVGTEAGLVLVPGLALGLVLAQPPMRV